MQCVNQDSLWFGGEKRLKKTFWSQLGKFADGLDIDNRRGLLLTFRAVIMVFWPCRRMFLSLEMLLKTRVKHPAARGMSKPPPTS